VELQRACSHGHRCQYLCRTKLEIAARPVALAVSARELAVPSRKRRMDSESFQYLLTIEFGQQRIEISDRFARVLGLLKLFRRLRTQALRIGFVFGRSRPQ
jgi:hypothetical protein